MTFQDLFKTIKGQQIPDVGKQRQLDDAVPKRVASLGFRRIRKLGDVATGNPVRLLLAVVTWSAHDMKALDVASKILSTGGVIPEVLFVDDLSSFDDVAQYVPEAVICFPQVAAWEGGVHVRTVAGVEAIRFLEQLAVKWSCSGVAAPLTPPP